MVAVLAATGVVAISYVVWKALAGGYSWTHSYHVLPQLPAKVALTTDMLRPIFTTKRDFALYVRKWLLRYDAKPHGVVFLAHGIDEHGGPYGYVARIMLATFTENFTNTFTCKTLKLDSHTCFS